MHRSRRVMFALSSLWVALLLVGLVVRGGSAVPVPVAPPSRPSVLSLAEQAEALAGRGDYEGAWACYFRALETAPEEVSLWYGVGVALSHLGRQEDTTTAFQYVVHRGRPASEEVRLARRWLIHAGVLAEPVSFPATADPVDMGRELATVKGRVTWSPLGEASQPVRVQLLLAGVGGPTDGKRFRKGVTPGEAYRFERIPAGAYRLIGAARGERLWDLEVNVEDGKEISLDLGKDNSSPPSVELSR